MSQLNLAPVPKAWFIFPESFSRIQKELSVDPGLRDGKRAWSLSAAMRGEMLEIWRRNGHQPSCAVARAVPLFDARRTPAPT